MDTAQISTIISLGAFAVAAYGIVERRVTATRAERIRLTSIIENLSRARYELVELVANGTIAGNFVEAIHARMEVLSQQAVSLVWARRIAITSAECRELAAALEETGYREDAEDMWRTAREKAQKEGETQALYTSRGYAYFLFRLQCEDEAREILEEALSSHPTNDDFQRQEHASTLSAWATWEIASQGAQAPIVAELSQKIDNLARDCSTPRGRAMVEALAVQAGSAIGHQGAATDPAINSSPLTSAELPAPTNESGNNSRTRRRPTRGARRR